MIALALSTVVVEPYRPVMTLESSLQADAESVNDFKLQAIEPPDEQLELSSTEPPAPAALAAVELIDIGAAAEMESLTVATPLDASTFGQIDSLFGADNLGMAKVGPGKGAAMFFGVRAKGHRFVYVVDNSNSMSGGKFETACDELLESVKGLYEDQYFYVVFFSDTAYPLFHPQPAEGMVRASEENIQKLEYWLETVQRCLRTDGKEAMQFALQLQPDAIYLLGDGSFTDDTVKRVLSSSVPKLTIHTLGFGMKPKAREGFELIAQRYRGKFTEVEVTQAMRERAKKRNRPRNRIKNGVWGLKLPAQEKKKSCSRRKKNESGQASPAARSTLSRPATMS